LSWDPFSRGFQGLCLTLHVNDQGLRIIKHKPFTLSTGVVLSEHLNELGWLLSTALWLGLTILFVWILARVFSAFGHGPEHQPAAPS